MKTSAADIIYFIGDSYGPSVDRTGKSIAGARQDSQKLIPKDAKLLNQKTLTRQELAALGYHEQIWVVDTYHSEFLRNRYTPGSITCDDFGSDIWNKATPGTFYIRYGGTDEPNPLFDSYIIEIGAFQGY